VSGKGERLHFHFTYADFSGLHRRTLSYHSSQGGAGYKKKKIGKGPSGKYVSEPSLNHSALRGTEERRIASRAANGKKKRRKRELEKRPFQHSHAEKKREKISCFTRRFPGLKSDFPPWTDQSKKRSRTSRKKKKPSIFEPPTLNRGKNTRGQNRSRGSDSLDQKRVKRKGFPLSLSARISQSTSRGMNVRDKKRKKKEKGKEKRREVTSSHRPETMASERGTRT